MQGLAQLRRSTGAAMCAECGKCTAVCPLAAFGAFSARGIACQHLEQELQGAGIGIRRCLTCGSCDLRCPQGVRFTDLVRGLRERFPDAIESGDCPHGGAMQALMRSMSQDGLSQRRLEWLDEKLETEPERGEVFYWTGCTMYYDAFFPELPVPTLEATKAGIRVLNHMGIRPVVSAQERCCGHDLLWNGDREGFERLARHNVGLVARSGATLLVTSCAECLRTWRVDYEPFFETGMPRLIHLAELVAERLPELRLAEGTPRTVTFQDPCRLGRHLGIYDPPRKVLAALPGVELREMPRAGRSAICCAGGTWSHCDRSSKLIQVDRLREARATGAQVLATACPKCRIHLQCAMKDPQIGRELTMEIRDVGELVAEALRARDGDRPGKEARP